MESQDLTIITKAIKTHRRHHFVLAKRAEGRKREYSHAKNAELLKEKHLNESDKAAIKSLKDEELYKLYLLCRYADTNCISVPINKFDELLKCGLTQSEIMEREGLLELQKDNNRWMIQEEFDRPKELSKKLFDNAGPLTLSYKEPCSNCKETVDPCRCMRNMCRNCGKSVGNITFSVCDDCWDKV